MRDWQRNVILANGGTDETVDQWQEARKVKVAQEHSAHTCSPWPLHGTARNNMWLTRVRFSTGNNRSLEKTQQLSQIGFSHTYTMLWSSHTLLCFCPWPWRKHEKSALAWQQTGTNLYLPFTHEGPKSNLFKVTWKSFLFE